MTKEEIRAGNELIARFMGYRYIPHTESKIHAGWNLDKPTGPQKLIGYKSPYAGKIGDRLFLCRSSNQLRFYNDIDWQLPVLEYIQKNFEFPWLLSHNTCTIYKVWMSEWVSHAHGRSTEEAIFICLVDAIKKYYNSE